MLIARIMTSVGWIGHCWEKHPISVVLLRVDRYSVTSGHADINPMPHVSARLWLARISTSMAFSLSQQDWAKISQLALTARDPASGLSLNLMINAYWEPQEFELPTLHREPQGWHCWLDTSLPLRRTSSRGLKPPRFQAPLTRSGPAR